jgi:hypothetical protein
MLTIVFYGSEGAAAKARAREISKGKPNVARVYDAMTWTDSVDACDAVEILPCVPWWKREKIEALYAGRVVSPKAKPAGLIYKALTAEPFERPFEAAEPPKRGRPPGSKNKPKDEAA